MLKAIAGLIFWLALVSGAAAWLSHGGEGDRERLGRLWKYASGSRQKVVLKLATPELIQVGDQIFLAGRSGEPAIGRVTRVESPTSTERQLVWADYAEAEFYSSAPTLLSGAKLSLHQNPQSIGWVIETMLSPQVRSEIFHLLSVAFNEHQTEIAQQLQPLLLESLRRSSDVLRADFRQAVLARSDELQAISARYRRDFINPQLTPLLRDEVWPIIQRESRPLANQIGEQLWDQASLWRLTWRLAYDASPLPQRDLTRKEFNRFVTEHVVPTLESHLGDFVDLQKRIISEVVSNEKVRSVAGEGFEQLTNDIELQRVLLGILNDVLTDNPRLKAVWQEVWTSPEAQAALNDANQRLEPTITAIGEALFGNPRKQITPEFSKVLRNKVLFKDQRWLVLHPASEAGSSSRLPPGSSLPVESGDPLAPNPFHVPARSRE
ncbi:MAG: hypothetical protein ACK493_13095 [Planctomycetota bacterium]|nr:hypothetical protein [Blastopirellula sp.]